MAEGPAKAVHTADRCRAVNNRPQVISFDCYGTLIDWESGIASALAPVLEKHGVSAAHGEILGAYAESEPALQSRSYRPYRQILREAVPLLGARLGFTPDNNDLDVILQSLPDWKPFSDTVPVLKRLKERFKLAILSNIDRALFGATAKRLEVDFDWIITAEDVRSYKPALAHFHALQAETGLPGSAHLHVAQSLFHDIAPARAIGLANVWVRRGSANKTGSAVPRVPITPDRQVEDLEELAALLLG